jgi:hypothetical protein
LKDEWDREEAVEGTSGNELMSGVEGGTAEQEEVG